MTRYIPCPDYDLSSEVEADYDDKKAEDISKAWANIIHSKAKECQILSDTAMNEDIMEALNEREFSGRTIIGKITKGMKKSRQVFALPYLSKKNNNNKTGEISVVIMHSPFADDGSTVPQMLEAVTLPVKLPFTKMIAKNVF